MPTSIVAPTGIPNFITSSAWVIMASPFGLFFQNFFPDSVNNRQLGKLPATTTSKINDRSDTHLPNRNAYIMITFPSHPAISYPELQVIVCHIRVEERINSSIKGTQKTNRQLTIISKNENAACMFIRQIESITSRRHLLPNDAPTLFLDENNNSKIERGKNKYNDQSTRPNKPISRDQIDRSVEAEAIQPERAFAQFKTRRRKAEVYNDRDTNQVNSYPEFGWRSALLDQSSFMIRIQIQLQWTLVYFFSKYHLPIFPIGWAQSMKIEQAGE